MINAVHELPLEIQIAPHDPAGLHRAVVMLADCMKPPLLVRVMGNLGAGKTTLIAALLGYWGRQGVNSPTFNLRNDYLLADRRVIHLDFYRLKSADDALDLLPPDEDYSDAVVFAEWPEKAPHGLFAPFARQAELRVEARGDETRHLSWRIL